MKVRTLIFSLVALIVPFAAMGQPALTYPEGCSRSFLDMKPASSFALPVGPFTNGAVATRATQGAVERQVWKTPVMKVQTLDLITPLKDQLEAQGYRILFECDTRDCGGFDFRFETDVVAEPDMHVDLGDFRYLSAKKQTVVGDEYMSILVSRSQNRGYFQVTSIGPELPRTAAVSVSTKSPVAAADVEKPASLVDLLTTKGSAVLEDVAFLKGAATLEGAKSAMLGKLALYLAADTTRKVILVGHTDAQGSLAVNIALSRKRATSVMKSLIENYGVNGAQVSAQGVGFLSPRASNATPEGRKKNRRVEVILATAK